MKIIFIVKPPPKKDYLKEVLKLKNQFEVSQEFTKKEGPQNARNLAKKAIEEGFERIIFVGGDGLINEGVNGIMAAVKEKEISFDLTLGIIPTGAGNNFAKELGIPKKIKKAFEIIKKNKTTLVDIGKVNDNFFVNCLSFGFDALVNDLANKIKTKYPFLPKEGSYLFAALKEILFKIPLFEIGIKSEKKDFRGQLVLVSITNGSSYGGIFKINPGASINDGKFNICFIREVGKLRAFFDIYKVIRGTHANLPEVGTMESSFLIISSPQPLPYEIDGEVLLPEKQYQVCVLPKKLKILTP